MKKVLSTGTKGYPLKLKGNADLEVLRILFFFYSTLLNCGTPCCRVLPTELTGLVKKREKKGSYFCG